MRGLRSAVFSERGRRFVERRLFVPRLVVFRSDGGGGGDDHSFFIKKD